MAVQSTEDVKDFIQKKIVIDAADSSGGEGKPVDYESLQVQMDISMTSTEVPAPMILLKHWWMFVLLFSLC